jgi:hypothetical protein
MNRTILFFTLLSMLVITSCEEEVIPEADFEITFGNEYPEQFLTTIPRFATYEPIRFVPKGGNVKKYQWNFGDDQIFFEKEPIVHFVKGGEYVITLIVESVTGHTSTLTKTLMIFDRVIEKIYVDVSAEAGNIAQIDWTTKRSVVMEIGILEQTDDLIPSTILYTSETVTGVGSDSPVFTVYPNDDVIIDYALLDGQARPLLVLQLFTVDNSGKNMFYSSQFEPGITSYLDYETGLFKLKGGNLITIDCEFK